MSTLICPRCKKQLSADHECLGLTRRFFFGLFAGAAASMAVPNVWGKAEKLTYMEAYSPGDYRYSGSGNDIPFTFIRAGKSIIINLAGTGAVAPPLSTGQPLSTDHWMAASVALDDQYVVRNPPVPFWKRRDRERA